ncbi:succinate dehydrogenase, hydrophobic membrane anchor protein [Candidatus Curculioniphilus buchneri]|uniref:succinate dehydrogenase, hydrophobic membrane anchor protein n=1 Tax=Candidatus Curculioniphilus buchneri TaxID=690594 RepID=UPI00376EF352
MVNNASSLGRSGVHEWLLIRASAIIIFFYIIYLLFFLLKAPLNYEIWRSFFMASITKIFTLLTLIAVLVHTWIGMWQVLTDYVKLLSLRLQLQLGIVITLIVYFLYGMFIVFGA